MNSTLIISVITVYFLVLILIAKLTAGKGENAAFFLGNRKSPWYIVAFGMIGASLSGITFISIPGSVASYSVEHGLVPTSEFSYMQMVFGYLIGYLVVAYVLLPIYYKMNVTSIYTYLENRFGFWSYKTGAAFFLLSRIIGASIRLLLVASVLQMILFDELKVPFEVTVLISVLLIWLYTNKGGIKTIIWTDTLQTAFMLASVILTIWLIGDSLKVNDNGGIAEVISTSGFSRIFYFENWKSANFFWKHFLGGIFITIGMTGLDQDMMQKNLSCKNLKAAQLNMVSFAGVLVLVNLIFLSLGALLYLYYQQTGIGQVALSLGRTDLLFAEIAQSGNLGVAAGILFLLGLIAAAYSSADSALTSLTTSFSVDFLSIQKKTTKEQLKIRKITHVLMSAVLVITVIILRKSSDDAAIWLLIKLAGFTYGPLIGLFFFGILTNRTLEDDEFLPLVCIIIPIILGFVWYLANYKIVNWFGEYEFGAELIIYNAIFSFLILFLISSSSKKS